MATTARSRNNPPIHLAPVRLMSSGEAFSDDDACVPIVCQLRQTHSNTAIRIQTTEPRKRLIHNT